MCIFLFRFPVFWKYDGQKQKIHIRDSLQKHILMFLHQIIRTSFYQSILSNLNISILKENLRDLL